MISRFYSSLSVKALASAMVAGCAMLAAPGTAVAQEGPEAAQSVGYGEILVTARRRGEDIARVPTSIVAIGTEALESRGIVTQSDLQTAVPGLTVRETQSNNQLNYAIRGQTVDAFSGSSTAVVPYVFVHCCGALCE